MSELKELQGIIRKFNTDRNWEQFHNIKNLTMALNVECSELLEIFQWLTPEQSIELKENNKKFGDVKDEMGDIFCYLLNIADKMDIDLVEATKSKIKKNEIKYPIEKAKDSAKKYNEL